MSWPERVECSEQTWPRLDFIKMGDLTFKEPDTNKYPSLTMGYAAGRAGGTMTGVFSAANEQAVAMFLDEKMGYHDIFKVRGLLLLTAPGTRARGRATNVWSACAPAAYEQVIEKTCDKHMGELVLDPTLDDIIATDAWAREYVSEVVNGPVAAV
eukprot:scaffold865_cov312-Prasinococcus_capsulatus_cf.AAC.18